ncbi:RNA 2',3'-cyclic phosphodiesterase [Lysobacter sp. LF1]|uniref:RNA 2',3'-cyclic phosphodiesterase n=1 Tax=Lysobacter stagni TaxID=3045172 RepID=A0ABT6XJ23_9GAMM|nr:RNA 2',3'-cyclic phosphodiesterase [Lysobacter sp. LF1]MDI9240137.1 RNA 2',3'-cyclic phosphodiesterase [Lysobacter sp. LF1]
MHRLFFALTPPDDLRRRIVDTAAALEREHAAGGRRLKPERYHVTLQFLGDFQPVPERLLEDALAAASSVRVPGFDLPLDCMGSFRGANVRWLGCQTVPDGLRALWDSLGHALMQRRVPVKSSGSFVPHLTIQRDVHRHLPPTPITPLPWHVNEFVLFDSRSGRPYDVLGRWSLG